MVKNYKKALIALAIFASIPAYADDAQVDNTLQPVASALPGKSAGFWDAFAFEVGGGLTNLRGEDDSDLIINPVLTLGVGKRVGEGVLLLRYNHKTNADPVAIFSMAIDCSTQDSCEQFTFYDELGLVYRKKFDSLVLGLGGGVVKRTVEIKNQDLNTTTDDSTTRGALFYELMFHKTISAQNRLSVGFGVQGQYNKDYPSMGLLVTFQKGL